MQLLYVNYYIETDNMLAVHRYHVDYRYHSIYTLAFKWYFAINIKMHPVFKKDY